VAEINTGNLIAFRPVAENAVGPEKPAAFLNVGRSVAVLREQRPGR
jgi:hypothetical protein